MSIYESADAIDASLSAPSGGSKPFESNGASKINLGPALESVCGVVTKVTDKAKAEPAKAAVIAAAFVGLIVLVSWGDHEYETTALGRCGEDCPDVLLSSGLINGKNGTVDDTCANGGTTVVDAVGGNPMHLHGDTRVSEIGAHFDGGGDYITVDTFDYWSDGTFTISYWYSLTGEPSNTHHAHSHASCAAQVHERAVQRRRL
jgi:hypothetical protein